MECPICSQFFSQSAINAHVNECLNASQKSDSIRTSSSLKGKLPVEDNRADEKIITAATSSSAKVKVKRKDVTNWGSLQPMRSIRHSGVGVLSPSSSKKLKTTENPTENGVSTNDNINFKNNPSNVHTSEREEKINCPNDSANSESADDQIEVIKSNATGQQQGISTSISTRMEKTATFFNKSAHKDKNKPPDKMSSLNAKSFAPLAERMRPKELENYIGQDKAVGKHSMLYSLLSSDHIPSIILWGPPGCGKTTLAKIIANNCRSRGNAKFLCLSAAVCGVNEVKETIKIARNDQKMFRVKTIMFLDEIHRFNKAQQDVLLPHIEDGTITLIGATTENPSFQVNSALLSRCRVVVLEKLLGEDIQNILHRALPHIGAAVMDTDLDVQKAANGCESNTDRPEVYVQQQALELLSNLVDGDARAALNGLQMAVEAKASGQVSNKDGSQTQDVVTTEDIKEGLQRSHVLYDKTGEEHYNIISALHKSMRGSDANAALYWLARMLEGGENPLYIARRLIRFACEDVGLADPQALPQAVAAYQGCHLIGMPECEVLLAQCTVYLSRATKSVEIYKAYGKAKACVKNHKGPLPSVPLHLRNAPTRLMKSLGYSKGYKYNPDYDGPVDQDYFPDGLVGTNFFS